MFLHIFLMKVDKIIGQWEELTIFFFLILKKKKLVGLIGYSSVGWIVVNKQFFFRPEQDFGESRKHYPALYML